MSSPFRGTTICAVRRGGQTAIAGDGQVTMGEHTIFKTTAKKVRRVYNGEVAVGFAGSVADAFTLCEKFIDPDEGIAAIGSGGNYALAAARALMQNTELSAAEIAEKALRIAASICVYTNDNITVETL